MTKKCKLCEIEKDESEFYKTGKYLRPYCKICNNKRDVEYQKQNIEKVYATRQIYKEKNKERILLKSRERYYFNRDEIKAGIVKPKVVDTAKKRAQHYIKNLIASGKLIRPEVCSKCGVSCKPHGHHRDYYKPLEVVWLCHPCHRLEHTRGREEEHEHEESTS